MYLRDLVRSLFSRWYLLLIGLLVTAGLGWGAFQVIPVSYKSQASMVLLPPKVSTEPNGNPYLYLGGLGQALDVLTRALDADAERAPLEDAHPNAIYEVTPDTSTSGPILLITSTAPTANGARAMTAAVLEAVPTTLTNLQTGLVVPADSRITVMTIAVDQAATLDAKIKTQTLVVVAAGGIALTILLTGFIDGLLRSRSARLRAAAGETAAGETAQNQATEGNADDAPESGTAAQSSEPDAESAVPLSRS